MNRNCGENVIAMPSPNGSAVLTMPNPDRARSSATVITMPTEQPATNIVSFPARADASKHAGHKGLSVLRAGYGALSLGVRMTLVALFALLGWPHPTRDNDPGPSAARPSHWELISLISRLHLPSDKRRAAAATVVQFPSAELDVEEEAFAHAA